MAALGSKNSNYLGRFVVIVDDDIDVTDLNDVLGQYQRVVTPKTPLVSLMAFGRHLWIPLSRGNRKTSSRAVIDACWPYERLPNVPKSL